MADEAFVVGHRHIVGHASRTPRRRADQPPRSHWGHGGDLRGPDAWRCAAGQSTAM